MLKVGLTPPTATITLTRPEVHNAFNDALLTELRNALKQIDQHPAIRTVILAAEGPSFCAGADLNWMKSVIEYSFEDNVSDAQRLFATLDAVARCSKPVIARIQGPVYGGGIGLVAACDMAVAVQGAKFCFSEVKLGLIPAVISAFVCKKVPRGMLQRYCLTAEPFGAQEAKAMGLVHQVVGEPEALDDTIRDWCQALSKTAPTAVAETKQLLDRVADENNWSQLEMLTTAWIARLRGSDEGQAGMRAFLEKRTPPWAGGGEAELDKTQSPAEQVQSANENTEPKSPPPVRD